MKFNERAAYRYAGRFIAEQDMVGPKPTDEALRQAFTQCCRIPGSEHYTAIRKAIHELRVEMQ
jgi:hypothetical protein